MSQVILGVEKPLKELEDKIASLKEVNLSGKINLTREIQLLEKKVELLKKEIYDNLSPWDRVSLARHQLRPTAMDFVENLCDDTFEIKGDRRFADDAAIIAGFAKFKGQTVVFIGHQKGRETKENLRRNFGMPSPEGLRKAQRAMALAGKFGFPILTFIDTPGAYPGMEAEERGQSEAIASNIAYMFQLPVPIIVSVVGEGGSGGALALGVGDYIMMLENAVYSVITPEGCASILWRDASLANRAAEALKVTAGDLRKLKVIDTVIPEPVGGIHRDVQSVYDAMSLKIESVLESLSAKPANKLLEERFAKFRKIGVYEEV